MPCISILGTLVYVSGYRHSQEASFRETGAGVTGQQEASALMRKRRKEAAFEAQRPCPLVNMAL